MCCFDTKAFRPCLFVATPSPLLVYHWHELVADRFRHRLAYPHRGVDSGQSTSPDHRHFLFHQGWPTLVCLGMAIGCLHGRGTPICWARRGCTWKLTNTWPHLPMRLQKHTAAIQNAPCVHHARRTWHGNQHDSLVSSPA